MNGIPNCVPEYFRSQQDDYEHECELEMERQKRYRRNREFIRQRQIDGCAEIRFYPDECEHCQHGEDTPMTSEYDDIPSKLCSNWGKCEIFRRELMEAFPNTSWEEARRDILDWTEK